MNLFQKDLSLFHSEMGKNRENYINLKQQQEEKQSKQVNLQYTINELNIKIKDLKLKILKREKINKKIKKLKKKRSLLLLVVYVLALCGFYFFNNFNTLNILVVLFTGTESAIYFINERKINNLINKKNELCNNKSLKEIYEFIADLEYEKNKSQFNLNEINQDLNELNNDIEKVQNEASKIHNNYKTILDAYEKALSLINSNISDMDKDKIINEEHSKVMPSMVSKIYNRKSV